MRMLRNRLAGVLAFVAVLAAGWASSALWVTRTIGDEARVESVAERFVASSEGRSIVRMRRLPHSVVWRLRSGRRLCVPARRAQSGSPTLVCGSPGI